MTFNLLELEYSWIEMTTSYGCVGSECFYEIRSSHMSYYRVSSRAFTDASAVLPNGRVL